MRAAASWTRERDPIPSREMTERSKGVGKCVSWRTGLVALELTFPSEPQRAVTDVYQTAK